MEPLIEVIDLHAEYEDREVLKGINLEILPASEVKPPLLGKCIVNLECVLESELVTGDHTVFAGRVVAAHVDESIPGRLMNFSGKFALARRLLEEG